MLRRYKTEAIVGLSNVPIPLPYATTEHYEPDVSDHFPPVLTDDLAYCDVYNRGEYPLSLYTGPTTDYAVTRFLHYTGTDYKHLQKFVLLTNYDRYMAAFQAFAEAKIAGRKKDGYSEFVMPPAEKKSPGQNCGTRYQMPAFHLKRKDGNGITIINIGVGPSNALNMTLKIAPSRPHAVIMVGHCAGVQATQRSGNFVIPSTHARFDGILDRHLSLRTPLAPIGEIQVALKDALQKALGLKDRVALNKIMQCGTVATVAERDWETNRDLIRQIDETTACAVEMESATVAGACLLNAIPHGSLLVISDNPLDGRPKLSGTAQQFYVRSTQAHLAAAIHACEALREKPSALHSRKLRRPRTQPAFR